MKRPSSRLRRCRRVSTGEALGLRAGGGSSGLRRCRRASSSETLGLHRPGGSSGPWGVKRSYRWVHQWARMHALAGGIFDFKAKRKPKRIKNI